MHYFPKDGTLRKKWTLFVRVHRKDFVPSKSATLCSVHFDEKCFESKPVPFTSAETGKAIQPKRYLIKGSVPTRYAVVPHSSPITSRKRRRVSKNTVRISWVFYNKLICFDCMKLLQFDSAHWSPCVYCIALFLEFNCYFICLYLSYNIGIPVHLQCINNTVGGCELFYFTTLRKKQE